MRFLLLVGLMVLSAGCGSAAPFNDNVVTQLPPFVSRVEPTSATSGDTVTLFGFGFSVIPPDNIVVVGGTAALGLTYNLVDPGTSSEIEQLTFTVPPDAIEGSTPIALSVYDNVSNADVVLEITP